MGQFPSQIPEKSARLSFAKCSARLDYFRVADSKRNMPVPFLATTDRSTVIGRETSGTADGTYKVLATLKAGELMYRLVAELIIRNGTPELRLYRFDVPNGDEWFAERKIIIPISRPEIAPLEEHVRGVDFLLCQPVELDRATAAAVFGPGGPPAI